MKKSALKTAAIVTIFDAPNMTLACRKRIAKWLRSRADHLEKPVYDLYSVSVLPRRTSHE